MARCTGRPRVSSWRTGEKSPTLKYVEQFARAAGVPMGMMLFPVPPRFTLPVPDFRADPEFRGFALVDPRGLLAFVNADQTVNGQLFTLIHEFAHV